jgi:hypothetical protein
MKLLCSFLILLLNGVIRVYILLLHKYIKYLVPLYLDPIILLNELIYQYLSLCSFILLKAVYALDLVPWCLIN